MSMQGGNFIVLDPLGKPQVSVYTINYGRLNVHAYAVTPEDWPAYKNYLANGTAPISRPRSLASWCIRRRSPSSRRQISSSTAVDLDPAFERRPRDT